MERKNQKRCRDGVPKSTQTRGDIKVKVNIQSLIHPYIFSQYSEDVWTGLCILPSLLYPSLFVYSLACHPYISLMIFHSCFCPFFDNIVSYVVK